MFELFSFKLAGELFQLPINIYNNYFSIGLDAYIQYQFHTGREAKPEKFNSRAYNKFVYFKGGFVDTFEQKYKDVSKFIELWVRRLIDVLFEHTRLHFLSTFLAVRRLSWSYGQRFDISLKLGTMLVCWETSIQCDGKDYTEKIREKKIHVILFLNIKSYGAGTNPWGSHVSYKSLILHRNNMQFHVHLKSAVMVVSWPSVFNIIYSFQKKICSWMRCVMLMVHSSVMLKTEQPNGNVCLILAHNLRAVGRGCRLWMTDLWKSLDCSELPRWLHFKSETLVIVNFLTALCYPQPSCDPIS